jgi:hypothetical protein
MALVMACSSHMAAIRSSMPVVVIYHIGSNTINATNPTSDPSCHVLVTRHSIWIDKWIY